MDCQQAYDFVIHYNRLVDKGFVLTTNGSGVTPRHIATNTSRWCSSFERAFLWCEGFLCAYELDKDPQTGNVIQFTPILSKGN